MKTAAFIFSLFALWGYARADICFDDNYNELFCDYGCCGLTDEYCCDGTVWGAGSIAGTVVGLTFFFIFVALIVVCCRRRRLRPGYIQQQGVVGSGVTVVSNTQQLNSVAGNVGPVYPQYLAPQQPGYPPAYPQGPAPAYTR